MMAKIGYARVSARSQKDDSQVDDLTAYGCDKMACDEDLYRILNESLSGVGSRFRRFCRFR